jgi:hypothetical protein
VTPFFPERRSGARAARPWFAGENNIFSRFPDFSWFFLFHSRS